MSGRPVLVVFLSALCLVTQSGYAAFTLDDDGAGLTVLENGKPVLVYRYGMVSPPDRVDVKFRRACYIHPLYGLDGEVLTQDFPIDHRHHRGVFWAWPKSTVGGRLADVWALEGIRQHHESWQEKTAGDSEAIIAVQNVWVFDDAPDKPAIREHVRFVVHPVQNDARSIDFALRFENIGGEPVEIRGSEAADMGTTKGYGGFCLRPDATRKPMTFTAKGGVMAGDALSLETPWCDVSFPVAENSPVLSGVAIFQHPANPGYPHPGWILRHYGFLGASWPHTIAHPLAPGESVELRYRILIHKGGAEDARVSELFREYADSAAATTK